MTTLHIGHTWSGAPIGADEAATLHLHARDGGLHLRVDAPFHGDPAPAGAPGPTDRLWEHEVVELFVLGERERYLEVELSPHGHHLVLRLDGVRRPFATLLPLHFEASRRGDRWTGEAWLPADWRPPGALRVNAYALHGAGASRRYLASTPLPGPHPDFHRLQGFVQPLDIW